MKNLDTILLIDDDPATNFLNKFLIEKEGVAKHVVCIQSAEEALEFIEESINKGHQHPEMIFLDINMPGMDGWEFLEAYAKMTDEKEVSKIVVMLTTSLDPNDRKKAAALRHVNDFLNKPLTREKIQKIIASV